jgi:hypothetical protein
MNTIKTTKNEDDFLFGLRRKRDEMYDDLIQELGDWIADSVEAVNEKHESAKTILGAMSGDLDSFILRFSKLHKEHDGIPYLLFSTATHELFYDVCREIKEREARPYDEAMKGRR